MDTVPGLILLALLAGIGSWIVNNRLRRRFWDRALKQTWADRWPWFFALALLLLPTRAAAQAQCVRNQTKPATYVCTFPVDSVVRVDTLRLTDTVEVTVPVRDTLYCVALGTVITCTNQPPKPTEPPTPPDTVVAPPDTVKPPPPDTTPKPPPVGASCPNEPKTWTLASTRSFVPLPTPRAQPNGTELDAGWVSTGAFSLIRDPSAPDGDGYVGQEMFNAGSGKNGTGTMNSWIVPAQQWQGRGYRKVYVCHWIWMDPNWFGSMGGPTLKQVWIHTGGSAQHHENRLFSNIYGAGTGTLTATMSIQGTPSHISLNQQPNLNKAAGVIPRGRWVQWEFQVDMAGTMDWWLNGTQVGHVGGIQWTYPGEKQEFWSGSLQNTYGGTVPAGVPQTQRILIDALRIRVSP